MNQGKWLLQERANENRSFPVVINWPSRQINYFFQKSKQKKLLVRLDLIASYWPTGGILKTIFSLSFVLQVLEINQIPSLKNSPAMKWFHICMGAREQQLGGIFYMLQYGTRVWQIYGRCPPDLYSTHRMFPINIKGSCPTQSFLLATTLSKESYTFQIAL